MDNKETGGSAFPQTTAKRTGDGGVETIHQAGMTLRDYFDAKALIIIAGSKTTVNGKDTLNVQDVAVAAYSIADAMLKERNKSRDE